MDARRRSNIVLGVLLVLLGLVFLLVQWVPGLVAWFDMSRGWPLVIVAVAAGVFLFGVLGGAPGMAVPACVFGGIGLLMYWQNATDNWASWAYAWALIPGFAGVGTVLMGLLGVHTRRSIGGGLWLIGISLFLFAIFGSFLGGPNLLGAFWPLLLIVLGFAMLGRALFRPRLS